MNKEKLEEARKITDAIKQDVLLGYNTYMSSIYYKYSPYYSNAEIKLMGLQILSEHILAKSLSCVKRKRYRKSRAKIEEQVIKRQIAIEKKVDLNAILEESF